MLPCARSPGQMTATVINRSRCWMRHESEMSSCFGSVSADSPRGSGSWKSLLYSSCTFQLSPCWAGPELSSSLMEACIQAGVKISCLPAEFSKIGDEKRLIISSCSYHCEVLSKWVTYLPLNVAVMCFLIMLVFCHVHKRNTLQVSQEAVCNCSLGKNYSRFLFTAIISPALYGRLCFSIVAINGQILLFATAWKTSNKVECASLLSSSHLQCVERTCIMAWCQVGGGGGGAVSFLADWG